MESDTPEAKDTGSDSGVKVPEAFQQQVYDLVQGCENKEMVDYIQDCCQEKMTEMYKSESESEYSDADMPKD